MRHAVCIIGAGPGGLQLGHLLLHEKDSDLLHDYVVLEQHDTVGSFFERFPVHRSLISLNKRHTRSHSPELRFRHDWNSLLGSDFGPPEARPVTERTVELYPHANVLVEYLRDFAIEQERAGRIQFGTQVQRIHKLPSERGGDFELQILHRGQSVASRRCGRVVVATGLAVPHIPKEVVGADVLRGYDELASSGKSFENRSVIIWGFGNAAHETARELQKYTQGITMLHRRPPLSPGMPWADHAGQSAGLPRFAFFTHYPGDVRTVTMQIYDTYLLKALDAKLAYGAEEEPVFLRCLGDRLCVWVSKQAHCGGSGVTRRILPALVARANETRRCAVEVGAFDPGHAVASPLMDVLADLVARGVMREGRDFAWGPARNGRMSPTLVERVADLGFSSVEEYLNFRARELGVHNEAFAAAGWRLEFDSAFLSSVEGRPLLDKIAQLRPRLAQDPLRHPFDAGIRCLGWRMNASMFESTLHVSGAADVQPQRLLPPELGGSKLGSDGGASAGSAGKYPHLDSSYRAVRAPGLYFVGALAHGRDYRRSAGGFIHGFRYTARALYRSLRREEGLGWLNTSFSLREARGRAQFMRHVWRRINEASGPYQMFGELADAVVFFAPSGSSGDLIAQYLEEVPDAYLREDRVLEASPRLVLRFVYGKSFGPLDLPSPGAFGPEFAEFSAFLHPRLELFEGGGSRRPLLTHALVEDVATDWKAHLGHVDPLLRFLLAVIARAAALLQVLLVAPDPAMEAAEAAGGWLATDS